MDLRENCFGVTPKVALNLSMNLLAPSYPSVYAMLVTLCPAANNCTARCMRAASRHSTIDIPVSARNWRVRLRLDMNASAAMSSREFATAKSSIIFLAISASLEVLGYGKHIGWGGSKPNSSTRASSRRSSRLSLAVDTPLPGNLSRIAADKALCLKAVGRPGRSKDSSGARWPTQPDIVP